MNEEKMLEEIHEADKEEFKELAHSIRFCIGALKFSATKAQMPYVRQLEQDIRFLTNAYKTSACL